VEAFLDENGENGVVLDDGRWDTLAYGVASLRERMTQIESDWDQFRDQAMTRDTLEEVSQVVDGYMLLGEDILERADRFTILWEEHVLPKADVPLDLGEAAAGPGPVLEAMGKAGSGADNMGPMMGTSAGTADEKSGMIAVDEQGNGPTADTGQRAEKKAAATSAAASGNECGGEDLTL
jgi:hypothetical protein